MTLNVAGETSCKVIDGIAASAMEPRSSALKTNEQAASTALCAWNISLSIMNDTSIPSVLSSKVARCFLMFEVGAGIDLTFTTMTPHMNVMCPSIMYFSTRSVCKTN
jgi:hypothetical protein